MGKSTQKSCTSENGEMKFPNMRDIMILEFWKLIRSFSGSPHYHYYHTCLENGEKIEGEAKVLLCERWGATKYIRWQCYSSEFTGKGHRDKEEKGAEGGPSWKLYTWSLTFKLKKKEKKTYSEILNTWLIILTSVYKIMKEEARASSMLGKHPDNTSTSILVLIFKIKSRPRPDWNRKASMLSFVAALSKT